MATTSYHQHLLNLESNYHLDPRPTIMHTEGDLVIERHDRGFGRQVHYAVRDGIPVGFVAGQSDARPGRRVRFRISLTFVRREHRRSGVARTIYRAIMNDGSVLISDWDQTEGAIALWMSLMRDEPHGDVFMFRNGYVGRRRIPTGGKKMSTTVTVERGTMAVARRSSLGAGKGCLVTVYADSRKDAMSAWGHRRIRREGCVVHGRTTFGRWLREQEAAGHRTAYQSTTDADRRARA